MSNATHGLLGATTKRVVKVFGGCLKPSFHLAFLCCIYIQSTPAKSTNIVIRLTAWLEAYVAVHAGP